MILETFDGSMIHADLVYGAERHEDTLILTSPTRPYTITYQDQTDLQENYYLTKILLEIKKADPAFASRVHRARIRELKKYSDSIYQRRSNGI